jgi:hypothetical protein
MDIKRKTVRVDADEPRRRSFEVRVGVVLFKAAMICAFCLAISRGLEAMWAELVTKVDVAKAAVIDKLTVTKVVTEYKEVDDASLGEIITRIAKDHEIDPLVLAVLAEKESAGGKALYRFEPRKFSELLNSKKYRGVSENELRMIASSHGVFHVMGYSARDYCDLHWSQLYNPWVAARCAAVIVARHSRDTADIKDPSVRVREVFRRFNGSGPDAERYADDAMARLAAILYKRVAAPAPK